ncbi:MAG: hypothetical protein R2771_09725 [Saprospiraceae bacterium]
MNKKYKISLLFCLLILTFVNKSDAKHIVGGEASYVVIESDSVIGGYATYEFTFTIYREMLRQEVLILIIRDSLVFIIMTILIGKFIVRGM